MALIGDLGILSGRPVDLIDLHTVGFPLLTQILTTGERVICADTSLYADLIKKMIDGQTDFMPYRKRILKERRDAWINQ